METLLIILFAVALRRDLTDGRGPGAFLHAEAHAVFPYPRPTTGKQPFTPVETASTIGVNMVFLPMGRECISYFAEVKNAYLIT